MFLSLKGLLRLPEVVRVGMGLEAAALTPHTALSKSVFSSARRVARIPTVWVPVSRVTHEPFLS